MGEVASGRRIKMMGIVEAKKERISKNGKKFAILELSDIFGSFDVLVFSEVWSEIRSSLEVNTPVLCEIDVSKNDDQQRLTAYHIGLLNQKKSEHIEKVKIYFSKEEAVLKISDLFEKQGHGKSSVFLIPWHESLDIQIKLSEQYACNLETIKTLKTLSGIEEVQVF